jgi:DNA helicase-2/ATP-dependent DNA helicase PcrA
MARIINEPKRGIGDSTFIKAQQISVDLGMPLFDVMKTADDYPMLSRTAKKLIEFTSFIDGITEFGETHSVSDMLRELLNTSGYIQSLDSDPLRKQDRLENLDQLYNNIVNFENENPEADLNDFLNEVSLMTDIDSYNTDSDAVVMMTIHSAKGLEFENVFLAGMEENIFPSQLSIEEGDSGIEEERRLAYVAITRAKKKLYITASQTRMLFGMTRYNMPSRFISEIPSDLIEPSEENKRAYKEKERTSIRDYSPRQVKQRPKDYGFSGVSKPKSNNNVTYKTGDTVIHKVFGEGVVLSVTPMSNDQLLEIAFLEGKTKKIMANFAKMEKK